MYSADRFPASATPGSACARFSARHCVLSQEAQQTVGDRQPSTRVAQLLIEVGLELASTPYFSATQRHLGQPRLHATGLVQLSHSRRTVSCAGRCGRTAPGHMVTAMFSPTSTAHFGIRRGALVLVLLFTRTVAAEFDVRTHGATGDGQTLDTAAIHRAIAAASAAGGGTVRFPGGTYLSFSIRLKSDLTLHLDAGTTLLAATPSPALGGYDAPEPNEWGDQHQYQDFGHSHWHNSLIWGENLENFAIIGPGRIDGSRGLVRNASYGSGRGGRGAGGGGPNGTVPPGAAPPAPAAPTPAATAPIQGNKAIALKNCRNVTLRDISLLPCGHFALLATGVDHLTLDNVKVDTNRDGFDIDACRHVRIANCSVNAPGDDAIVLKSSFALGAARACEDVTITNCSVTGFDAGTFLDGTYQRTMERAADRDGPTGRIKFGTESNGGSKISPLPTAPSSVAAASRSKPWTAA